MAKVVWTPERKADAFARICALISSGKSLVSICKAEDMPSAVTVYEWLDEDAELANRYARARERQADHYADEIIDIADSATDANLARLQVDSRKWTAGKLRPKVYGDKLQLEGDMAHRVTDDRIESRIAQLYGKAGVVVSSGGTGETEGEA